MGPIQLGRCNPPRPALDFSTFNDTKPSRTFSTPAFGGDHDGKHPALPCNEKPRRPGKSLTFHRKLEKVGWIQLCMVNVLPKWLFTPPTGEFDHISPTNLTVHQALRRFSKKNGPPSVTVTRHWDGDIMVTSHSHQLPPGFVGFFGKFSANPREH